MSTFSARLHAPSGEGQSATWNLNDYPTAPRAPSDNAILKWNEQLLEAIRATRPRPARPSPPGRSACSTPPPTTPGRPTTPIAKGTRPGSTLRQPGRPSDLANKSKAISYAAYRVLTDLFPVPPHAYRAGQVNFAGQMTDLGYDPNDTTTDTDQPRASATWSPRR